MVLVYLCGGPLLSFGLQVTAWVLSLAISAVGIFMSLYLYISHDDVRKLIMQPAELSENLNDVSRIPRAL